jgi:hypothetical protein
MNGQTHLVFFSLASLLFLWPNDNGWDCVFSIFVYVIVSVYNVSHREDDGGADGGGAEGGADGGGAEGGDEKFIGWVEQFEDFYGTLLTPHCQSPEVLFVIMMLFLVSTFHLL